MFQGRIQKHQKTWILIIQLVNQLSIKLTLTIMKCVIFKYGVCPWYKN